MGLPFDLRLFLPPILNIVFFIFLKSQGDKFLGQDIALEILQYPLVSALFFILAVQLLLVFLFTPIRLTLSAGRPIIVRSGDFSVLLFLSILASFVLQPSTFWLVYLFLIIISPLYSLLWSLFERFFSCLRRTLRSLPTFVITWADQSRETPDPVLLQLEETERFEAEGNKQLFAHNEPSILEQVVIDG